MDKVTVEDWFKQRLPMLISIAGFFGLIMIMGFLLPDFISCCGDYCSALFPTSNDILVTSMNARLDIIHNILWSIPYKLGLIFTMFGIIFTTLYVETGMKRFLGVKIADYPIIILTVMLFSRGIFYMQVFGGLLFGGCV